MLKIERILCPVDFSDFSARAYDYAYSMALRYGAKLYVEHVVEVLEVSYPYYNFPDVVGTNIYCDLNKGAEGRLQEMVRRHTTNDLQAETVVHKGFVPDSIVSFARDLPADLIVMGTHGRRGLDRLVMGSVTESVLRKSPCPVLAVRKPAHDFVDPERPQEPVFLRKILLCTDFSPYAHAATEYALSLAEEYNAELTLLHVVESSPHGRAEAVMSEGHKRLEDLVPLEARNQCKIRTLVRVGKPYEEIIQVAVEGQADVAVLGVRGHSAADLAIFGSTTHRVLQLGPCPVLAVHDDRSRREFKPVRSWNFMRELIETAQ